MAELDLCLEIDPSKFLLVIGPDFTTNVIKELSEAHSHLSVNGDRADFGDGTAARPIKTPAFALKHIVDEGIQVLLDTEEYSSEAERSKCELLYRNAYELDPQFALKKVSLSLQKSGRYAEWLRRAFEVELRSQFLASHSVSLHHIINLQSKGALLVYVHCDDILSRISRTSPVLLEDPEGVEQWLKGEKPGFLHVHGVYWEPSTVKLDGQFYESSGLGHLRQGAEQLKLLFRERQSVVIRCESHSSDPLLSQFIKEYMSDEKQQHHCQHTFHLPLTPVPSNQAPGLPIVTTSSEDGGVQSSSPRPVHSVIAPITESSLLLCKSQPRTIGCA